MSEPEAGPPVPMQPVSSKWRWLFVIVPFVVAAAVSWNIYTDLKDTVWSYFTDDENIHFAWGERDVRMILNEDPYLTPAPFNTPGVDTDAAFSPDGVTMIFSRANTNSGKSELYESLWDGLQWSSSKVVNALSPAGSDTRHPAWSPDGETLYFASDRDGGQGGMDIWRARHTADGWQESFHTGERVNTAADEGHPMVTPDNHRVYFTSTREGASEVYSSKIAESLNTNGVIQSVFAPPVAVKPLTGAGGERGVSWSPGGGHVFSAAEREAGKGGLDL